MSHPKLQNIAHIGDKDNPVAVDMNMTDAARRIAFVLSRVFGARGKRPDADPAPGIVALLPFILAIAIFRGTVSQELEMARYWRRNPKESGGY